MVKVLLQKKTAFPRCKATDRQTAAETGNLFLLCLEWRLIFFGSALELVPQLGGSTSPLLLLLLLRDWLEWHCHSYELLQEHCTNTLLPVTHQEMFVEKYLFKLLLKESEWWCSCNAWRQGVPYPCNLHRSVMLVLMSSDWDSCCLRWFCCWVNKMLELS